MLINRTGEISSGYINTRRAIISSVVAFILTVIIYLVLSLLAVISLIPEGAIRGISLIVSALASFFAGYLTARNVTAYGLINGVVTGLIYFLITYIFGAIINLSLSFNGKMFLGLLTVVIASALGGIFGINHRATRYRRRRRR